VYSTGEAPHDPGSAPVAAQGVLFTDDLPERREDTGYRGPTACNAAGITYRQLDYWARTGLVEPSVRSATGSGTQRLYGFRDILVLKVVKRLLDSGVSLQQIRIAISHLRERGVEDLAQITLMSDGASVYQCTLPWVASGARSRASWPRCPASRCLPSAAQARPRCLIPAMSSPHVGSRA